MNCLIIDDNSIARTTLHHLADQIPDLTVMKECANALEAYQLLSHTTADILFLDIEMPEMTGIELTRQLKEPRPIIIFTTARKNYALEAFELNVADYLVKPITPARFLQSVERARELLESKRQEVSVKDEEFLFIRDSNIIRRIATEEILYAEAMGDYVKLHTAKKFFAVHSTLKAVEEKLPPNKFLRVHRSYIIALNKIDSIREGAIYIGEKSIPVADSFRSALNQRLNVL